MMTPPPYQSVQIIGPKPLYVTLRDVAEPHGANTRNADNNQRIYLDNVKLDDIFRQKGIKFLKYDK